jgi:hypothetical protein
LRIQPLGGDFYAACNFMQFIAADGGGDRPEAVLAGLEAAFHQEFRHSARRVVVLAGDAPPHPEEERRLLEAVRRFTDGGTSFVHALVTGRAGVDGRDVETAFRRIAERGRGVYARIEDPDRILQEVLAAAFGSRYAGNLAIVQQRLAAQRAAPPTWALDLARSGEGLQKELQRHPVADELVQALLRRPSRAAALQLVKTLGAPASSAAARQAAAYVLQRLLRLAAPPIDPLAPRPLTPTAADQLRAAITAQLPR